MLTVLRWESWVEVGLGIPPGDSTTGSYKALAYTPSPRHHPHDEAGVPLADMHELRGGGGRAARAGRSACSV